MSNKEKATKISWLTLAFMAFSTVWGFGNITNGFVYFNGPQVIFSWIFMFVLSNGRRFWKWESSPMR